MRPSTLPAALIALAAVLAGCATTNTQQSTGSGAGNERSLAVDVPSGATQLRVDTSATAQAGTPDVTVLVKDESGNILGTHTWALKDRSADTLTVDLTGQARLLVIAKVIDGDASLDVNVTALVPGQPEVVVIHQTLVITQTTTTTTTPSSPTPTTSTPAPTPTTTTPTPAPTPATNGTNNTTTNATAP